MDKFTFFEDFYETYKLCSMEERDELITSLCEYAFNDKEPVFKSSRLEFVWLSFKKSIDTNKKFAEAGRKGGSSKKVSVKNNEILENRIVKIEDASENITPIRELRELISEYGKLISEK